MLQLRQLDLKLAFSRARALGENIQDQRGPIQNLATENFFQVPALGGRQFVIKDDRIDVRLLAMLGEFLRLAGANERAGAGSGQLLDALADHLAAGRSGQFGKFFDGIAHFPPKAMAVAVATAAFDLHPNEKYPLRPPVPGLDQCFQIASSLRCIAKVARFGPNKSRFREGVIPPLGDYDYDCDTIPSSS